MSTMPRRPSSQATVSADRRSRRGFLSSGLRSPTYTRRLSLERLEERCLLDANSAAPLYVALADSAATPTNPGLLMIVDTGTGQVAPWDAPFSDLDEQQTGWELSPTEGFSGLAFDRDGTLFGATTSGAAIASRLLRIDPHSGKQIAAPLDITSGGQPIRVGDLAVRPGTNSPLYGLDAGAAPGRVYDIDPVSGQATPLWQTPLGLADGLAFGADGTRYVTGVDLLDNRPKLYVRQPDGTERVVLLPDRIVGLDVFEAAPATAVLFGSTAAGALVTIDAVTGQTAPVPTASPLRGVAGDVAFQPQAQAATFDVFYEQHFEAGDGGYTADNTGGTWPGLWHYSVGRRDDQWVNHTPNHNWYYGHFESSTGGGNYSTQTDHQGVLISPEIDIPQCGPAVLSFSYHLDTRESLDEDFVYVQIDDGTSITTVLSRQAGTLPQTGNRWLTATADLSQFAGQRRRR